MRLAGGIDIGRSGGINTYLVEGHNGDVVRRCYLCSALGADVGITGGVHKAAQRADFRLVSRSHIDRTGCLSTGILAEMKFDVISCIDFGLASGFDVGVAAGM